MRNEPRSARRSPAQDRTRRRRIIGLVAISAIAAAAIWLTALVFIARQQADNLPVPEIAALPTDTITPIPSDTATPTATLTPTDTLTHTPTATATITPTFTVTASVTPTHTATLIPSLTPTVSDTPNLSGATETEGPPPTSAAPNPCISLVGDSVTHGGVTYEIPATGYIVGLTTALAKYMEDELQARGITNIPVYDRGASNTGISSTNHPSYFNTPAYRALLRDHCKTTMIMPWLNDISPGIPASVAGPRHVRALINLARELADGTPGSRIIVLNYFHGDVAPFAEATWASGFTTEDVDIYNHEIALSCNVGSLSNMPQIACVNIEDAFENMDTSYVIGYISRQDLKNALIAPLPDVQAAWLQTYYDANPDGMLLGDGVHLSVAGKKALAAFLVTVMS